MTILYTLGSVNLTPTYGLHQQFVPEVSPNTRRKSAEFVWSYTEGTNVCMCVFLTFNHGRDCFPVKLLGMISHYLKS